MFKASLIRDLFHVRMDTKGTDIGRLLKKLSGSPRRFREDQDDPEEDDIDDIDDVNSDGVTLKSSFYSQSPASNHHL